MVVSTLGGEAGGWSLDGFNHNKEVQKGLQSVQRQSRCVRSPTFLATTSPFPTSPPPWCCTSGPRSRRESRVEAGPCPPRLPPMRRRTQARSRLAQWLSSQRRRSRGVRRPRVSSFRRFKINLPSLSTCFSAKGPSLIDLIFCAYMWNYMARIIKYQANTT